MKSATRVLASIAMGGAVAGAAAAIWQVPAPKAATTAAVSGSATTDAMQQLADETAQLHEAIVSTQTQLAQLRPGVTGPSASPDLDALLAEADSQLATARQRLALDEALLAKLRSVGHGQQPSAKARTVSPMSTPTPSHVNPKPTPAETPSASFATHADSTPTAVAPPRQRSYSPSPRSTNRGGDD
jgi:hypothetical protein